jgi:Ca2+/Na+ antiporter
MALSLITAAVAIAMVIFGLVASPPDEINGDLYQLLQPLGIVLFVICAGIMYYFRGIKRSDSPATVIDEEDKYYNRQSNSTIWLHLLGSGIAILFAAETMVKAVRVFCEVTGMPLVIAGVLAGVVGCLGEMMVIHNYTVHPKGRIGDALVGVAMDNIVTTMGAAIVAIMGGIFLGGSALIVIFVLILAINTVLIYQVNKLKDGLITVGAKK